MKRNIIFFAFFIFFVNINSQEVRVIDNKGTMKSINKVTYGTVAPSITSPKIPNNRHTKGDMYIIGDASSPERIYLFDGVKWVNITSADLTMGYFIIDYNDNGTGKEIRNLPFKPSKISFVAHANIGTEIINSDNDFSASINTNANNNARSVHNSFGTMNGYALKNSQQVIYVGGHGNSINDISRYASNQHCVGLRFSSQNGDFLGSITAKLISFDSVTVSNNGFTLAIEYTNGVLTEGSSGKTKILPSDIQTRKVLVMYTAYK